MIFSNLYEEMFYKALRIRLVEERIIDVYPTDKIQSPVHLSIGQEAVAVGVCESLRPADLLFGSYRNHAYYLAKGGDIKAMFAELFGKKTGCGHGKGGSMHLIAPEVGLMGSSAVVASTIPHAVGAAMAAKELKKDQIIVSVFGDGATDEGAYHESLNFASLHELPIVFVCENNGLAVHSKVNERHSFEIREQASSYGFSVAHCKEGYDFMKVHETFSRIQRQVRENRKPQFLEVETFRYREHVGIAEDFDAGYRSREEFERWKARDPLATRVDLISKFRPAIQKEIYEAVEYAERSPWPGPEDLLMDVT
jgi:TPP-dependent pyruvate/acetoin dehydrogenase alpha subunit